MVYQTCSAEGNLVSAIYAIMISYLSIMMITTMIEKIRQPTRKQMKEDVIAYMRYYNLERFHTANGDLSPIEYEQNSLRKVS
ncbi:hypothetical protein M2263_002107 [Providencia alcalifaciens]|nr:hypothetical protein [Providencia alcalifaciens]